MASIVYLIPTALYEGETNCLPSYILDAIKDCHGFFVENERTSRRFFKSVWKEMVIDDYKWYTIKQVNNEIKDAFKKLLKEGKNVGILSEAGCPGVADPGQQLIHIAQQYNYVVKPLVGPNSILLALMASGMNGQHFRFAGYLPIDVADRVKTIKSMESESRLKDCTQIFIETPYRNNQLLETLIKTCAPKRNCV